MTSTAIRTHCLDASALVKHYINEKGSDELRDYLKGHANWYTTPFCLFEALGVLKRKYKSKKKPDAITQDEYHKAGCAMLADYDARSKDLPDLNIIDPFVFFKVKSLCEKYPKLDFSDAFQILSVQGKSVARWGGSIPILITADKDLSLAAKQEGLQVKLLGQKRLPQPD
jgi:predicted nucleic acid-binding protein